MNIWEAVRLTSAWINQNAGILVVLATGILLIAILVTSINQSKKVKTEKAFAQGNGDSSILDGREAEILRVTWEKLQMLRGSIAGADPLNRPFIVPAFKSMNDDDLREFLETSGFSRAQREKFAQNSNKEEFYADVVFWHRLNDAKAEFNTFYEHFTKHRFFISKEACDRISEMIRLCAEAVSDLEYGYRTRDINDSRHGWALIAEANRKAADQAEPVMQEIQRMLKNSHPTTNN
jgi:hypothetical protein